MACWLGADLISKAMLAPLQLPCFYLVLSCAINSAVMHYFPQACAAVIWEYYHRGNFNSTPLLTCKLFFYNSWVRTEHVFIQVKGGSANMVNVGGRGGESWFWQFLPLSPVPCNIPHCCTVTRPSWANWMGGCVRACMSAVGERPVPWLKLRHEA